MHQYNIGNFTGCQVLNAFYAYSEFNANNEIQISVWQNKVVKDKMVKAKIRLQ